MKEEKRKDKRVELKEIRRLKRAAKKSEKKTYEA